MKELNILITGAGSTMGQSVLKALLMSRYRETVNVFVTNSEPMGAGYFMSERVKGRYLVPIARSSAYLPAIIDICKKEHIHGIFSGTEHEIYALSNGAAEIKEKTEAVVFLSRPEVIDIGTDKYKTWEFFHEHNLPFPMTVLFNDYQQLVEYCGYPIFMKPRTASASRNIFRIDNEAQLFEKKFADNDAIVLQQYLDSNEEYTVEAFCDRTGHVAGIIPMVRDLNYGMSYYGEIDRNEQAIEVSHRIAVALKPEGALNIQLRMVHGNAIPFEINTRFSSTECVRAHYGYNSVEATIDHYLYGLPVNLNHWKTGMFLRYWHECYFDKGDVPVQPEAGGKFAPQS